MKRIHWLSGVAMSLRAKLADNIAAKGGMEVTRSAIIAFDDITRRDRPLVDLKIGIAGRYVNVKFDRLA
jgi:hypothetical protein